MKWLTPQSTLFTTLAIAFLKSWPTRAELSSPKSAWPAGTVAHGSSTHPVLANGGTSFYSSYAIDGDTKSFWNDDTVRVSPDTLTIEVPSSVTLLGIILLSSPDGWVLNYTVETLHGSDWTVDATIAHSESALQYVPFASPVNTTQLRIVVTDQQYGEYTRINEVYPILAAAAAASSNASASITTPSGTTKSSSTEVSDLSLPGGQRSSAKKSNVGAIVGGVLGGIILILVLAVLFLFFRFRKRKQRNPPFASDPGSFVGPTEVSTVPAELSSQRYGIPSRLPYQKPELESR